MMSELEALYAFHRKLEAEGFKHQCIELWNLLEKLDLKLREAPAGDAKEGG